MTDKIVCLIPAEDADEQAAIFAAVAAIRARRNAARNPLSNTEKLTAYLPDFSAQSPVERANENAFIAQMNRNRAYMPFTTIDWPIH